ncbi:regulatory-associated protein of mTOR-like isoform X2 [Argiope bruennichi]|uniref:Regulatory-associated protein of mTOR like protein n=1 Tax=Argiope bruennichi TaxID=94029 RepID=A0A8T0EZR1_ARGBR|nr:regulatory-associated protein of mTOR-like isoform X2 [Argiope bruennichi]KAF8782229.1 Regulatory-associated protein of mTOR like protein [Argiope bruennichi]
MLEFSCNEEALDLPDWYIPIAFNHKRHTENIEGSNTNTQKWRMKDRMKTVSVALVLCLNVGVDPPDIIKTQPCARLECWIDPLSLVPQKALDSIAAALQKQYEKWQPRARYKHSLDPTVDEVKRLCTSLRRNAKDERVLFHYNGHGVPKPTSNGEIWVFNKTYTQYIPLSIYDLQQWMGAPSIYVYDCSCAGLIVESFKNFALQHEREFELLINNSKTPYDGPPMPSYSSCIQLAACGATEILPMNPDLPADLFTSCLTTPVIIALKWFVLQQQISKPLSMGITMELIDKIPGQVSDRRTMLGELNWIFTAITDTIAWNVLPKETFQKLFRQDLLVASLFRNFLLAERIMRFYNCTPVSSPSLPSTYHHHMWKAWDFAVDTCLTQLPAILADPTTTYSYSPFFSEQLTAFQVWLNHPQSQSSVPEQLPIVLQVLLSQVHRLRALELLGRFLDLGPWAVNLALSVGIFPYVLKLLQSSARELRPLLVFIWAKVLAVDCTCQSDLVRDGSFKYFLAVLGEPYMPAEHRTMAAFCVSCIVSNYKPGQVAAMQSSVVSICLEQLSDPNSKLRQWVAICLGRMWNNYEQARWCGVRDSAHEKLEALLSDANPEVRAAAVFALGTFLNSTTERTDHANAIDHSIGMMLINKVANDGSPLVRQEVLAALQWFLIIFENQFVAVGFQYMEEEKAKETSTNHLIAPAVLDISFSGDGSTLALDRLRRVSSSTSISSMTSSAIHSPYGAHGTLGYASVFGNIWKTLINLSNDPYPDVAKLAEKLVNYIKNKVNEIHHSDSTKNTKIPSMSEPSSPSGRPTFLTGESPPSRPNGATPHAGHDRLGKPANRWTDSNAPYQQYQYFAQFNPIRKTFDKGPKQIREVGEEGDESCQEPKTPLIETQYVAWSTKYFSQPVLKMTESDIDSPTHATKEWYYLRNQTIRNCVLEERKKLETGKFDEQIFINKNINLPTSLRFHPYESHMVVTDKECYSIWDWEKGYLLRSDSARNHQNVRITAVDFLNAHDETLLMIGSDDGVVKIWKNYTKEAENRLITAFQVIQDLLPSTRGSGLVLQWEQHASQLLASGDVRHIRIWDSEKEMKVQDLPTGADSCVTCLTSSPDYASLIAAGCGDGTVRIYDRRMAQSDCCLHIFQEHSGWVVNIMLQNKQNFGQIISGSVAGDVRFWDLRHSNSIRNIPPAHGMTAMAIHPQLDLIACGAANQFISVFNQNGDNISTIKYHDGFMGHRIGPISCLGFHPYKASLGAGSTDHLISVYSVNRKH